MASLSEMVATAQAVQEAKRNSSPAANFADAGLRGLFAGYQKGVENRRQHEKDILDRNVKLLDIQEKLAKIQESQQITETQKNISKWLEAEPTDPSESLNARGVMNETIGGKGGPSLNTTAGKLPKLLANLELSGIYMGKGGTSFSFQRKGAGKGKGGGKLSAAGETARRTAIQKIARQMAVSEVANKARASGKMDFEIQGLLRGGPPEDVVMKYIPTATKYYDGDTSGYEDDLKKLRNMSDPMNLFGGAEDDLQGLNSLEVNK